MDEGHINTKFAVFCLSGIAANTAYYLHILNKQKRTIADLAKYGGEVIRVAEEGRFILDKVMECAIMIVLEGLVARIERFRVATVRDLYNLCGVSNADFAAGGYGWTDLNTAAIRQRYGGWLLDLPEPEPIRN